MEMKYSHYWIEHPNSRRTGVALGLCPVLPNEMSDGRGRMSIMLVRQDVDSDGFGYDSDGIDYENSVGVLMTADDMARFIHVLHGRDESICDGKGIMYHHENGDTVLLRLWHQYTEPLYAITMSKKDKDGNLESISFSFTEVEATVICNIMEHSIPKVCFGD